jgi:hypothetical protein
VLNSIFLIITLFLVYPLKFLTRAVLLPLTALGGESQMFNELAGMIGNKDWGALMVIYGLGAASVFVVLALMYRYALRKKDELDLNDIEVFDTRTKVITNLLLASVPMLSAIAAMIWYDKAWVAAVAGPIYFLYTPVMFIFGSRTDKVRRKLLTTIEAQVDGISSESAT